MGPSVVPMLAGIISAITGDDDAITSAVESAETRVPEETAEIIAGHAASDATFQANAIGGNARPVLRVGGVFGSINPE